MSGRAAGSRVAPGLDGMSHRRVTLGVVLVSIALSALAASALCTSRSPSPPVIATSSLSDRGPRAARVLIHSRIGAMHVRSDAPLTATCLDALSRQGNALQNMPDSGSPAAATLTIGSAAEWARVALPGNGEWVIAGKILGPCRELALSSMSGAPVDASTDPAGEGQSSRRYPGELRFLPTDSAGVFDVVNVVDVEQYTACVVVNEVWPTFSDTALRAQAIASRTFVLYQMGKRESHPYDVSSTQGSQVYKGLRDDALGRRAEAAARDTRGVVCTVETEAGPRLFCAYYSAACGGVTQSAAIFGPRSDVEPLVGGVRCDYCRGAPPGHFRWGPVRINRDAALDRLAVRFEEARTIDRIVSVEALERSAGGRVVTLRVTAENGTFLDVLAERLRLALGGGDIRSTAFDARVDGENLVFENGRGFGHGLGLCQWGAQGLSLLGKSTAEILHFYYPGMRLARAY